LSACADNPYKQFYQPAPSIAQQELMQRRIAPPPEIPELYHGGDLKTDIPALAADGYVVIGMSTYSGPEGSDHDALQQGKAVGADRIMTYHKYARTVQTALPLTLPTTQTSITNGTATAFGAGGAATAYGSALTTTYGSQTTFIPMSVDRFDFLAVYLVKVRSAFGAQYRNLNTTESKQVGTVNGVVLATVVHGSPAAAAGFLPGDIVMKADGQPVADQAQFTELVRQRQGQRITVSINRAGHAMDIPVVLASY
jgi:membrane-associated protease RseP (regulator of RpoE activity)